MTRFLLLATLVAAVGCNTVQMAGPFAKSGTPTDAKDKDAPPPGAAPAPVPTTTDGRPLPPAILITPGEVAPDDPAAALTKLGNEIEYDLKNTPPAPKTPIISRYKNGEKVE